MSKFNASLEAGHHAFLNALAGQWAGIAKTWFEKDVLADESPVKGEISSILGGRFIKFTYEGALAGKPLEGVAIWGYDLQNDRCECSWVDSFHMGTGILLSKGTAIENGFSVLGSYGWPGVEKPWGWRTELRYQHDELILTAYNISPEGEEAKATEAILTRS